MRNWGEEGSVVAEEGTGAAVGFQEKAQVMKD